MRSVTIVQSPTELSTGTSHYLFQSLNKSQQDWGKASRSRRFAGSPSGRWAWADMDWRVSSGCRFPDVATKLTLDSPAIHDRSTLQCFDELVRGARSRAKGLVIDTFFDCSYIRRKFRSQTSDNMDRWKAEHGRGREKRKIRREKIRRERVRGQKIQMREKVGKSRNTVFFQWFVAPEGRKVGSLKRRVRTQLATGTMKNCTPLWREAHFQVKMYKTHQVRTTFGSYDVEKVHAVVARSTFPSQNVQNTSASDHFWKLRCRKSARRCGAKCISKWKCTKHTRSGPLLEVAMSKKCTPLWREAHFQVKSVKNWRSRTTFGGSDVEKVSKKCTPLWREAHFEVKSVKNWGFWAFFDVQMSKR